MHSNCMSVLRVYKCLNWLILITLRVEEQKTWNKDILSPFLRNSVEYHTFS